MSDTIKELVLEKSVIESGFRHLFIYLEVCHPNVLKELLNENYSEYAIKRVNEIKKAMKMAYITLE